MLALPHLRAYTLLILTTWCWGLNAIVSRLAIDEISPMQMTSFRWLGAVILLGLFARRPLRRDWPILRRHLRFVCVMGACGFTVFNALFYVAGHHTTAVNIGILQGAIPIFVVLGTVIFLQRRLGALQAVGVLVTLLGVAVVASGGALAQLAELEFNRGDVLMVTACFFYAAYSIGLSRRPPVDPLTLFAVMACVAWITSLPLLAAETWLEGWHPPTLFGWGLAAFVTIFPSLIGQVAYIHGVMLIGPGRAGVFVNLVPVFAALMAVLLLDERFAAWHALALSLVLCGIALSEAGKAGDPPLQPANSRPGT